MGCCCSSSSSGYTLLDDISLADQQLPIFPESVCKLRDCTPFQTSQLKRLFVEFDLDGDDLISLEELEQGLKTLKKNPSRKAKERMLRQMHMSSSPSKSHIELKGFCLAILSRRSLLYSFLYEPDFDTLAELEEEKREDERKGRTLLGKFKKLSARS